MLDNFDGGKHLLVSKQLLVNYTRVITLFYVAGNARD